MHLPIGSEFQQVREPWAVVEQPLGISQTMADFMDETKSYAVFESDFPDDSQEQGDEIVVPAGRNIVEALCEKLSHAGAEVKPPSQQSFYAWFSEFLLGKITIWFLLQQPGPWLLIVEARAGWLTSGHAKTDAMVKGIEMINEALLNEAKIRALRWMTKEEFESFKRGGAKSG